MRWIAWAAAPVVFLTLFGGYAFRLGIQPALEHDDFEYTYPSFDLAERGSFGSPLLGPGLNVANRTYNLIVYYYASVHAVLIRLFGDGAESIPLANTFHFALLSAVGCLFLLRRGAFLGAAAFLLTLVSDSRVVDAARRGRPEMTAGCCLTLAVMALWLWVGEGRHRPLVLFAMSAALTAGMLSHTSVVFFALALVLTSALSVVRGTPARTLGIGFLPYLALPTIFGYFVLTDSPGNITGQLALARGNVELVRVVAMARQGGFGALRDRAAEFIGTHAGPAVLWVAVFVALALPAFTDAPFARAARFFAGVYGLFFAVHFLCLKTFVISYRVLYEPTLYLALALVAEALLAFSSSWQDGAAWRRGVVVARVAATAVLLLAVAREGTRFRERLLGHPLPFARLQGALSYVLLESGAHHGDRVLVPSPFGFHLRRTFDVLAQPAPNYVKARWSHGFRDGLRGLWGPQALENVSSPSLCDAMALAYLEPMWVVAWDADYSTMQPFYDFLRKYPDLPGIEVTRERKAVLPPPYSGTVRVYRLVYSDGVLALDRRLPGVPSSCP